MDRLVTRACNLSREEAGKASRPGLHSETLAQRSNREKTELCTLPEASYEALHIVDASV